MKIITRYVLREHIGPLMFAFIALTSLMLLNFISRQFGELVGKGLPLAVIGEFFFLSIPFTVALTIPMSVLVAVLYAFSRLAAENEVMALKANGVSPWRLVSPAIFGGVVMSVGLLAFNDQVLPRANHRLKTLQDDISQTKPTLLLKEQIINTIAEGKFYLKAGKIDRRGVSGRMKEVVIYDLADATRRRTIYADSGRISFAANKVDIDLDLYHGQMQEVATDKPSQLDRLFFTKDRIRIKGVGRDFTQTQADSNSRGDREMGICEMQKRLWITDGGYRAALKDYEAALKAPKNDVASTFIPPQKTPEPRGIGWAYCTLLQKVFTVKTAEAAELDVAALHHAAQDTIPKKVAKPIAPGADTGVRADTGATQNPAVPVPAPTPPPAVVQPAAVASPVPDTAEANAKRQEAIAAQAAAEIMRGMKPVVSVAPVGGVPAVMFNPRVKEAELRLELAERGRNRYDIEIHKKFSLAAACLIFCILAPPLALRFPRGGVGLVIGVSLAVFALYYVGLIGGEAAANKGLVAPFWAMWGTNVIMTLVGLVMLLRVGRDSESGRGGGLREWFDTRRLLRDERRAAAASTPDTA